MLNLNAAVPYIMHKWGRAFRFIALAGPRMMLIKDVPDRTYKMIWLCGRLVGHGTVQDSIGAISLLFLF